MSIRFALALLITSGWACTIESPGPPGPEAALPRPSWVKTIDGDPSSRADPSVGVTRTGAEPIGSIAVETEGVQLRPLALRWTAGDELLLQDEDRFAVVVGADRYRREDWDVPFVGANLDAVSAALAGPAAVPPDRLAVLRGTDVHRTAVEEAILRAGEEARSPRALLVLYLTGHGYVDADGQPFLFTHYTREDGRGGFELVIGRDDLNGWAARAASRAADNGSTLRILAIVDACRVPVLAPPPGADVTPLHMWELYGTQGGRFAAAPDDRRPSPFTRALVEVVEGLDRGGATGAEHPLSHLFDEVRRRTMAYTRGRQEPELVAGGEDDEQPDLLGPRRVTFAVRVVDVAEQLAVPRSTVELDGVPLVTDGSLPRALVAPGDHLLRVSADGFLTRSVALRVDTTARGRVLEVDLRPDLAVVRGVLDPPGVYEVRAIGLDAPLRKGFHNNSSVTAPNGAFELRLPRLAEGVELVVPDGPEVALRRPLPLRPDRVLRDEGAGGDGVAVVDLGTLTLDGGLRSTLLVAASRPLDVDGRGLLLPLPDDLDRLAVPELSDRLDAHDWQQAMELLDLGHPDRAVGRLSALTQRTGDPLVGRWLVRAEVERLLPTRDRAAVQDALADLPGAALASSGALHALELSWRLEQARDLALLGDGRAVDLLVEPLPSRVLAGADRHDRLLLAATQDARETVAAGLVASLREARRWDELLVVFERFGASPGWSSSRWSAIRREVATEALQSLLERGTQRGITSGDWSDALLAVAFIERHASDDWSHLDGHVAAFGREHVSLAVRESFQAGGRALARGDLEAAMAHDEAALAGANEHYRTLIATRLTATREQLYIRHSDAGLQAELAGDVERAITAYLTALDLDDRAVRDLRRLRGAETLVPAGDGRALAEAVATAPPLGVVRVPPGEYRVSLVVERAVVIEADGDGEVLLRSDRGPALTCRAPLLIARGLRLSTADGPALVGAAGRAELSSCEVVDGGVEVVGLGARLLVRDAVLWAGARPALRVQAGGEVRLEGGLLRGQSGVPGETLGLVVGDGGRVVMHDTGLMHCDRGLRVERGGDVRVVGGMVASHAGHGAEVLPGGRLQFDGTQVQDNGGFGLIVRAGGHAEVVGCRFRANTVGALDWEEGADLSQRDNVIHLR